MVFKVWEIVNELSPLDFGFGIADLKGSDSASASFLVSFACVSRANFLFRHHKKYVPCPAAELSVLRVAYLCAVFELVAELVHPPRLPVIEIDLPEAKIGQCEQLARFGNAIVISITP